MGRVEEKLEKLATLEKKIDRLLSLAETQNKQEEERKKYEEERHQTRDSRALYRTSQRCTKGMKSRK